MPVRFLLDVFRRHVDDEAVVYRNRVYTYGWLLDAIDRFDARLEQERIGGGVIVSLESDFSADGIALFLSLIQRRTVVVPLALDTGPERDELLELGQVERRVITAGEEVRVERTERSANHPLYLQLREAGHPGLVLFTSGSTGAPKAAAHDMCRLLEKYHTRRHRLRTLTFLRFDHIGGVDTLLQALSNGSTVVIPDDRSPERVCETIARHKVEVLPASPSFLAMLLLSEANQRHDLSSLRYITYGAEVMPLATLRRLAERFPKVTLLQKYGLTELGTLRSRSRSNDTLWVKVGGEGFQTRVVDGLLEIKARSSMLGYLNAPSPFTNDGWFRTGDLVEVDGEYMRILGRASDLINVGGQKVYPAEVEDIILGLENIADVIVTGEPHPLTGQIVVARVSLQHPEEVRSVEQRVREYCRSRLARYKIPVKVDVLPGALHSDRQKKIRRQAPA